MANWLRPWILKQFQDHLTNTNYRAVDKRPCIERRGCQLVERVRKNTSQFDWWWISDGSHKIRARFHPQVVDRIWVKEFGDLATPANPLVVLTAFKTFFGEKDGDLWPVLLVDNVEYSGRLDSIYGKLQYIDEPLKDWWSIARGQSASKTATANNSRNSSVAISDGDRTTPVLSKRKMNVSTVSRRQTPEAKPGASWDLVQLWPDIPLNYGPLFTISRSDAAQLEKIAFGHPLDDVPLPGTTSVKLERATVGTDALSSDDDDGAACDWVPTEDERSPRKRRRDGAPSGKHILGQQTDLAADSDSESPQPKRRKPEPSATRKDPLQIADLRSSSPPILPPLPKPSHGKILVPDSDTSYSLSTQSQPHPRSQQGPLSSIAENILLPPSPQLSTKSARPSRSDHFNQRHDDATHAAHSSHSSDDHPMVPRQDADVDAEENSTRPFNVVKDLTALQKQGSLTRSSASKGKPSSVQKSALSDPRAHEGLQERSPDAASSKTPNLKKTKAASRKTTHAFPSWATPVNTKAIESLRGRTSAPGLITPARPVASRSGSLRAPETSDQDKPVKANAVQEPSAYLQASQHGPAPIEQETALDQIRAPSISPSDHYVKQEYFSQHILHRQSQKGDAPLSFDEFRPKTTIATEDGLLAPPILTFRDLKRIISEAIDDRNWR